VPWAVAFGKLDLELMPLTDRSFSGFINLKTKQPSSLLPLPEWLPKTGEHALLSQTACAQSPKCEFYQLPPQTPEPWHRDHLARTRLLYEIDSTTHEEPLLPKRRLSEASLSRYLGGLGRRQEQAFSDSSGNAVASRSGPCCVRKPSYKRSWLFKMLSFTLVCNAGLHQANLSQNRRLPCLESFATSE
jgi:hypothetical protein